LLYLIHNEHKNHRSVDILDKDGRIIASAVQHYGQVSKILLHEKRLSGVRVWEPGVHGKPLVSVIYGLPGYQEPAPAPDRWLENDGSGYVYLLECVGAIEKIKPVEEASLVEEDELVEEAGTGDREWTAQVLMPPQDRLDEMDQRYRERGLPQPPPHIKGMIAQLRKGRALNVGPDDDRWEEALTVPADHQSKTGQCSHDRELARPLVNSGGGLRKLNLPPNHRSVEGVFALARGELQEKGYSPIPLYPAGTSLKGKDGKRVDRK
jgi:hypothetical protein